MNAQYKITYQKSIGQNLMCLEPIQTEDSSIECVASHLESTKSDFMYKEDFRIKIIINNNINGIAKTHIQYINSKPIFCYNISGFQSLAVVLESKPLDYNLLSRLLYEIYDTLVLCEKYMLDIDKFIFSPELVYLSPDYSNIALCYYPLKNEELNLSLRSFFDYLLKHINHTDERCVYITYSLHNHCLKDSFTPDMLMSYLSSEQSKVSQDISTSQPIENKPISSPLTTNISQYTVNDLNTTIHSYESTLYKSKASENLRLKNHVPQELLFRIGLLASVFFISLVTLLCLYFFNILDLAIFFVLVIILLGSSALGAYNIYKNMEGPINSLLSKEKIRENIPSFYFDHIEDAGNTVLLSAPENNNIHSLIYTGTDMNSKIELAHYPFTIGKSNDCDFTIQNPIISRLHSRICCQMSDSNIPAYYIEDLNSTNGTCLNNLPLAPYEKHTITPGDNISFGHLTYIFR